MNSPFANIFLSLIERIKSLTTGDPATPVIRYIDLNYGQLESYERPAIDTPTVLIDFPEWHFEDASRNTQLGQGLITLTIATEPYSETDSLAPLDVRKAGIDILDIEYQLYQLLQNWKPTITVDANGDPTQEGSPLDRVSITSDNRRPGLKVRTITFSASFTDFTAKTPFNTAAATLAVTKQLDIPT